MALLVTGATGLLGRAVVARLLAEGEQVRVLSRRPFLAHTLFGDDVSVHEWHPITEDIPDSALADVTGVVHLMGESLAGVPLRDRARLVVSSRTTSARKLAEAIGRRAIRVVAASVVVVPEGAGDVVTEAEAAAAPDGPASDAVVRDVLAWEAALKAIGAAPGEPGREPGGPSIAIVRMGLLAGAGAPLRALVGMAAKGMLPDFSGATIPAIDIEDAAAMLSGLSQQRELTGVFHGVAPQPVKGEELAALLAKARRLPFAVPMPRGLLRRQLGPVAALLTCRSRIAPQRLIELGADFSTPNPTERLALAIEELRAARATGLSKRWPMLSGARAKPEQPG